VRVVVQRVIRASVRVAAPAAGASRAAGPVPEARIGPGLLLFAGFRTGDDDTVVSWMAEKCLGLRIFADGAGAMNLSVAQCGGAILVVPNFTLYGETKGRRPGFADAAPPEVASQLFAAFVRELQRGPVTIETGFFQTHMHVELVNDGPVTLLLEREAGSKS
jgi:D-tyrosyl-tRNA(Tyr) deacylase